MAQCPLRAVGQGLQLDLPQGHSSDIASTGYDAYLSDQSAQLLMCLGILVPFSASYFVFAHVSSMGRRPCSAYIA